MLNKVVTKDMALTKGAALTKDTPLTNASRPQRLLKAQRSAK